MSPRLGLPFVAVSLAASMVAAQVPSAQQLGVFVYPAKNQPADQFAFKLPAGAKKLALEDLAVTLATRSR